METVCYTLTRIRRQLKITKNTKEVGIKTNGTSCYEEIASNITTRNYKHEDKKNPLNPNKVCVQSQGVWKQYVLQ
jgi:hypothetical protein